ncbi:MAG: DUF3784 domain-containing protein [Flavobacteriales bacterium]|nr:DUF3784 domain-containing protein [Flavobacteriales bacterium]
MDTTGLLFGLVMIGTGFLVKLFPNLIAGYNTMSKDEKKNVDIEGLSTFLRNGFIAMGLIIIFGYYLFRWIGFIMIANSIIPVVILLGVAFTVINARRFDHNKIKYGKIKLANFIGVGVFIFVAGLIAYAFFPTQVQYDSDTVKFTGMYGTEIIVAEIENIQSTGKRPGIKARTNGFSLGRVQKGFFSIDGLGRCRLLFNSRNPPYLIISQTNGDITIINFKDKTETETAYNRIKTLLDR